jgi:hypothetical protein
MSKLPEHVYQQLGPNLLLFANLPKYVASRRPFHLAKGVETIEVLRAIIAPAGLLLPWHGVIHTIKLNIVN